jgi:hypothetical protein
LAGAFFFAGLDFAMFLFFSFGLLTEGRKSARAGRDHRAITRCEITTITGAAFSSPSYLKREFDRVELFSRPFFHDARGAERITQRDLGFDLPRRSAIAREKTPRSRCGSRFNHHARPKQRAACSPAEKLFPRSPRRSFFSNARETDERRAGRKPIRSMQRVPSTANPSRDRAVRSQRPRWRHAPRSDLTGKSAVKRMLVCHGPSAL